MASTTYNISRVADGVSGTEILETRVFKGTTYATFALNFIAGTHQVVKIKFSADGSTPQLFQGRSLPSTIEHTFQPAPYTYLRQTFATISIYYSNFETYDYLIPIKIAQPSYFSDFEDLHVIAAQFTDTSAAGDMFVTIAANNNLHHMNLLANETAAFATTTLATSILVANSATTTTQPPIATIDGNLVEVVTN